MVILKLSGSMAILKLLFILYGDFEAFRLYGDFEDETFR